MTGAYGTSFLFELNE